MDNPIFMIIISLIWGFGLALLLKKPCENECIVYKVPADLEMKNNIIYDRNRCYKLEKYASQCTA